MWGHFSKATKHMKMKYLKKEKQGNVIIVYKIAWKKCLHGHNNENLNIQAQPDRTVLGAHERKAVHVCLV